MSFRRISNFITLILVLMANGLANSLPLNGITTGEISAKYPTLFTPAGYVFSIWGLIYLGLLAFGVFQLLPSQRQNARLERIGYWFTASNLLNATWIFLWHYEIINLTLLIMLGILITLLAIYLRLGIGKVPTTTAERWLVDLPFSIYLGWITVATVANASVALYRIAWTGWGIAAEMWTIIMLLIASLLGILMTITRREVAYPLVLSWAFIGIAVQWQTAPLIAGVAVSLAIILLIMNAGLGLRRHLARA